MNKCYDEKEDYEDDVTTVKLFHGGITHKRNFPISNKSLARGIIMSHLGIPLPINRKNQPGSQDSWWLVDWEI